MAKINLQTKGCDCIGCKLWPFIADGWRRHGDGNVVVLAQGLAMLAGRLAHDAPEHMRDDVVRQTIEALAHAAECTVESIPDTLQ